MARERKIATQVNECLEQIDKLSREEKPDSRKTQLILARLETLREIQQREDDEERKQLIEQVEQLKQEIAELKNPRQQPISPEVERMLAEIRSQNVKYEAVAAEPPKPSPPPSPPKVARGKNEPEGADDSSGPYGWN